MDTTCLGQSARTGAKLYLSMIDDGILKAQDEPSCILPLDALDARSGVPVLTPSTNLEHVVILPCTFAAKGNTATPAGHNTQTIPLPPPGTTHKQ